MSQVVATAAQHLYEQEAARNDPERHEIVSELYRQLSRFRLGHDPHFSPAAVSTGSSPSPSSSSTSSFPGRQPLPRSQRLAALAPALCPLSPRTPMSSFSDTDTEEENDDGAEGDEDNDDSGRDGELGANTGRLPFVPPVFRRTSRDRTPWPSSHGRGSDATAPDSDADDEDDDYDQSNSSATGTSRNGSYASSGGATTVVSSMTPPRRLSSKVGPIVTVAGNAARPSLAVPRRQSSHQIQRHNLKRRRESQVTAMNDGTLLLLSPARYGGRRERCQSISAAPSALQTNGKSSPRPAQRRPSTAQPLLTASSDAAPQPLRPLLGDRRPSAPDRPDVFVAMTTLASPTRAVRQEELKLASPFRKHGANLTATMMTDDDSPALPASPSPPRPAASHWRLEPVKLCAPYDSHFYSEQQRSQGGRGDEMSPLMRRASEAATVIGDGVTSKPPRVRREVPLPPVIIPKPTMTAAPAMERGDSASSSASSSAASRFSYHTSPNSVTTALSSPATPSTWGTPPCLSSLPSPFPGLALPLSAAASSGAVCGHDMPAATSPARQRPATASKAEKPGPAAVVFSTPSFSPSPSSMIPARRSETIRYEGESWLLCSP